MECLTKLNVSQNGMSHKMECQLNGLLLKMEYHSKLNVTQNFMLLKMEYHSKWNVTLLKRNVTQNEMSFKIKCH